MLKGRASSGEKHDRGTGDRPRRRVNVNLRRRFGDFAASRCDCRCWLTYYFTALVSLCGQFAVRICGLNEYPSGDVP